MKLEISELWVTEFCSPVGYTKFFTLTTLSNYNLYDKLYDIIWLENFRNFTHFIVVYPTTVAVKIRGWIWVTQAVHLGYIFVRHNLRFLIDLYHFVQIIFLDFLNTLCCWLLLARARPHEGPRQVNSSFKLCYRFILGFYILYDPIYTISYELWIQHVL